MAKTRLIAQELRSSNELSTKWIFWLPQSSWLEQWTSLVCSALI